jgi:catechol 2,3-dioxygenase-like lactoylglutathione lyase family enzyme
VSGVTKAPAIERLAHYALVVSDVEATSRWYGDVLGAEVRPPQPGFPPQIVLAGTTIDMFPRGGVSPAGLSFGDPAPGSIGQHHAFAIGLEQYDAWVAHFESVGQRYRCAAHGARFMSIYVDDPDGYHIELTVPFDDEALGGSEMAKRGLKPTFVANKAQD